MKRCLARGTFVLGIVTLCAVRASSFAAEPDSGSIHGGPAHAWPPIRDNSFLLEEAYNQEERVLQFISAFTRDPESQQWIYTMTTEWPLRGEKQQLSFTVPYQRPAGGTARNGGPGDVSVNYRYQILGGSQGKTAFAPRLSLLFPTGDAQEGRGSGARGVQVNLPVSVQISSSFVLHSNLGATLIPGAKGEVEQRADLGTLNVGQSLIWLARPQLNLMLESSWSTAEEVTGPGRKSRSSSFFLAPGVRGAFNFRSGLQVVPGVAVGFGLGESRGDRVLLLYLSFERPYGRSASGHE